MKQAEFGGGTSGDCAVEARTQFHGRPALSEHSASRVEDGSNLPPAAKDVGTYASLIRTALGRSARGILETAKLVAEAREALGKLGFRELAEHVGMSHGTLSKWVTIYSCRDRFLRREDALPSAWTVLYRISMLPDLQFETLAASGKLRPELSEKEVSKFAAQRATFDATRSASDELAFLSVKVVFPALLSAPREDDLKRKIFAALGDEADVTVKISERRKFKASRK